MHDRFDTMMEPQVEELLDRAGSKFSLVALASQRARQINSYYGQLGDGLGTAIPPQVTSTASKSLSTSSRPASPARSGGAVSREARANGGTYAGVSDTRGGLYTRFKGDQSTSAAL